MRSKAGLDIPADSGEAGVGANIGTTSGAVEGGLDSRKVCHVPTAHAYPGRILGVGLWSQASIPKDTKNPPVQRHRTHRRRYPNLRRDAGPACQIPDGGIGEVVA